ncbi:MAG: Y-family DNA polymerase [Fibrobacter sp.]|nr:Y-family DNA polymerase [Fibrobacter sp.]
MFALIDCNSFYASCERLFRPDLQNTPIVVLSNNDGCAVAMCAQAKKLGIKTGEPYFKIKSLLQRHQVQVFSSNYTLYGDISRRVMQTLEQMVPQMEVYSIDEAFLDLSGMKNWDLKHFGAKIRARVLQNVGIPTCVGIAPTKVLAKAANRVAKKFPERTAGVWVLDTPAKIAKCLRWLAVEDVWGIGRQSSTKLHAWGIKSAADFCALPPARVQKLLGIVGVRLQQELQGVPCLPLELHRPEQKSICTSRTFGKTISDLAPLKAAVSFYTSQCAKKLRQQKLCAQKITVFLHTNRHRNEQKQHHAALEKTLPVASNDTLELNGIALELLAQIWRPGLQFKKAGVRVSDLVPQNQVQSDLFDTVNRQKSANYLAAMDQIHRKHGAASLHLGVVRESNDWQLRRDHLSPQYTTNWEQLFTIYQM